MNILLIVCDTLRFDHLGCYSYFRDTSPNIDCLAEEGVIFEDFYTAGAPTGPAFTCIYTGLHAIHHKYYQFTEPNVRQIDDTIFTMPEILSALGYTTAAIDNLIDFEPHSKHWVRGYAYYINPTPGALRFRTKYPPPSLRATDANKKIIPWIKTHSKEEFFLFVHYWDPHLHYIQPQKYREVFRHKKGTLSDLEVENAPTEYQYVPGWGKVGQFVGGEIELQGRKVSIDLYDGEILYMDHAIGEVISALNDENILDDTLIIVTSDHGEDFKQHSMDWNHLTLHDTVVHIPLIMRYPKKLPNGIRVKGFGQHIDLLPTILDVIGAPTEALNIDGKSLLPLLKGKSIRDKVFMEQVTGQRAVRTKKWKLIFDKIRGKLELYNIEDDPVETINLIKTENEKARELKDTLDSWVKANLDEGEKDPVIYEEWNELSRLGTKYLEKKLRLFTSFSKIRKNEARKNSR